jgi:HEAT repeat protein
MKYEEIKKFSKNRVESVVAANDEKELSLLVLSLALYSEDADFAENICLRLSNHESQNVRGNAVLGFGHISRVHGKLNEDKIKPIIERALTDEYEYVRSHAHSAKGDVEHFLNWKF